MTTNTHHTRLRELAERLETTAQQARLELRSFLVNDGYSGTARRDLVEAVDALEAKCAAVRLAVQRDRGTL